MKLKSEAKIGIIVLLTLLALLWGINYLKGRNIFDKSNTFHVVYQDVSGLDVSSSIYLKGFKVGMVDNIHFEKTSLEDIVVSFSVDNKFKIPEGSVIELFSSDIMGTKALQILPSNRQSYHKYGDTLLSSREKDLIARLQDEILPLKDKAEETIVTADSLLASLQNLLNRENQQNLSETFMHLNQISNKLNQQLSEDGKLNNIMLEFEKFAGTLSKNRKKLDDIFSNMEAISDSLARANVAHTIEQINQTFHETSKLLSDTNKGKGSLGLLASDDSLYNNLQRSLGSLNSLLQDLEENPKKYVHFSLFGRKQDVEK